MLQFGQKVEINYAGFLEDGTEFVNTWLSPDSVSVTIGQSGLLPAFEQALVDMHRGQRKTIDIPCEQAYGSFDESAVITVAKAGFPHADELPVGEYIEFDMAGGTGRARVVAVDDETIVFDCNPELAGHDLRFEIELVDVEGSTALDQESEATGCGCDRLRESLGAHHRHDDAHGNVCTSC